MAIAYDSSASGGSLGTASWSHTCTGSNGILIVAFYDGDNKITGVTYNSVSMTQFSNGGSGPIGGWFTHAYYLLNPSTGSNTITLTSAGSNCMGLSSSYTGVKQSGFPDSSGETGTAATPKTQATTVVASNCWLIDIGAGVDASGTPGVSTNRTDRQTIATAGINLTALVLGDSNGTVGTGSQSTTFTSTGTSPAFRGTGVYSMAPYIPPPTNGNFLAFM